MAYMLACRDLGKDCDFVISEDTKEAVIARITEHLKLEHGYTSYQMEFPENIDWIKCAIKKGPLPETEVDVNLPDEG